MMIDTELRLASIQLLQAYIFLLIIEYFYEKVLKYIIVQSSNVVVSLRVLMVWHSMSYTPSTFYLTCF